MIYPNWFIKEENLHLLEEYHRATDLLDLSKDVEKFENTLTKIKESCVVWLIWKLWSGKTTFLNQFIEKTQDPVLQFEGRKYPWRKDLWENFVLEVAEQLWQKPQYLKKIDWKQNDDKKTLIEMITNLPWKWKDYIPWVTSMEIWVQHLLETTSATRTFQFQELLTELLESIESDTIYIAIEDVDRAGEEWLFFLETLSYYIKEVLDDKKIIVISLIGEENFNIEEKKLSFQKCLDLEFNHSIKEPSFEKFVNELFIDEIINDSDRKWQIVSFFEWLFKEIDGTTMRIIKRRLRKANLHYQILVEAQKTWIDRRICILLEFAKAYFPWEENKSYFELWKQQWVFNSNSIVFWGLLNCVVFDNHRLNEHIPNSIYQKDHRTQKMKLVDRTWTAREIKIMDKDYIGIDNKAKDDPIRYYKDEFSDEPSYFWLSYAYFE